MTTAIKDVPTIGTISYNGFTFGGEGSTPPTYSLRGEPQYDESRRTVAHTRYRLQVATVIHASQEAEVAGHVDSLRQQLSQPGKKLILHEIGWSETAVDNVARQDIDLGPRPRVISLKPIGGALAWELHWECEFCIAEPPAAARSGNWSALNFESTYAIDDAGFTMRTIRGHVLLVGVPLGLQPGTRRTPGADAVRDQLRIALPAGFERRQSQWTESADQRRLDFVVVDEERRGQPLPPGIAAADVRFRTSQTASPQGGDSVVGATATLEGWMEAAAGQSPSLALTRLWSLAVDRANRLRAHRLGTSHNRSAFAPVMPMSLAVEQSLFGRRCHLTIEFQLAHCLGDLLLISHMWQPVTSPDSTQWRSSTNNRGAAGLAAADNDVVIDLVERPANSAVIGRTTTRQPGLPRDAFAAPLPQLLSTITPAASWLSYAAAVRVERRENATIHRLSASVASSAASGAGYPGVGPPFTATPSPAVVREVHGEPIQQVVFEGAAQRLAFIPAVPVVVRVGGRQAIEHARSERRSQRTLPCGTVVHEVRWQVVYDIAGYIREVTVPQVQG